LALLGRISSKVLKVSPFLPINSIIFLIFLLKKVVGLIRRKRRDYLGPFIGLNHFFPFLRFGVELIWGLG